MARKVNFDYEKRQKDLRKQKKRQAKLEARRARKESGEPAAPEMAEPMGFEDQFPASDDSDKSS